MSRREFTCCWTITLGKSVSIVTVGPFHQCSGTTSRTRRSFSFMFSLKLDTPCVTSPLPPSFLREIITAWRDFASITSCDFWSARHSPNATNQVCSRPGWYGSLMFSCISFQLPGMRWRE